MIVTCSKCGIRFERHNPQKVICRPCEATYQREYMREYRKRNPSMEKLRLDRRKKDPEWVESQRARGRDYWNKLRHLAVMAYGGYRCACCGETEPKFLTLDHIFNDGNAHRKSMRNRGAGIYKWLRDHKYPAGFQILCMNCNHGKALNKGVCPHKNEPSYEKLRENGEHPDRAIPCQASEKRKV